MTRHPEHDSQQIHAALDRFATPGLAVAVVKNDELVLAQGFGLRGIDQPKLLDVDFAELEFTRAPAPGKPD